MKRDTTKTPVQFYVEPDGQILAYFLRERSCYAHVGQHSQCTPEYIAELKPATPEQYKDLKSELESIGYRLHVEELITAEQAAQELLKVWETQSKRNRNALKKKYAKMFLVGEFEQAFKQAQQ